MHNNDEINEAIQHFKLTKKDQQLLVAGATLMTVATAGAMATTTNAHADTVKDNNVKTEQVNKVNNNVNNGWHANSVTQIKQAIQKQGGNVYTIQYGDTLSAIAQAMNINMTTLQQINHIANANVIIAGNKIGFSADHQNVQVMNNQGKVIAQAPVHANAPVATPVVNHAVATPVAHTATPAPVVHTTTVNKPVTTTHTEYVPQQVTTTKEVPTQVTTNQTKTVTKNVPVTTTDANGNQTTTMKPETTTETVPVTTTVNKPVTTTTTVNKPVTVTDTTNQPTTTTTTTPSQTTSSSVDNGSASVANPTTSTTNNSNADNSSSSNANTANSGQLVNGYTPQQSGSSSASADSSSSQASQSSSSSSMSNGYQPQNNNSNSSSSSSSVNEATCPQVNEYINGQDDNNGLINYFTADAAWWDKQPNAHALNSNNSDDMNLFRQECLRDINLIREENGLGAVTEDDFIDKAAQYHANYEAQQRQVTHGYLDANGQQTGQDVSDDYIQKANKGNDYGNGTECCYGGNTNFTPQGLADAMFVAWLSDPAHRYGLLDEVTENQPGTNKDDEYSKVGFGVAQGSDGDYYGTFDGYDVPSDSNFYPLGNSSYTNNVQQTDGGTISWNNGGSSSITYN